MNPVDTAAAAPGLDDLCGITPGCEGVVDAVTGGVSDVVSSASSNVLQNFADAITEALANGLAGLGTLWVNIRTAQIDGSGPGGNAEPVAPPKGTGDIEKILEWAMYVSLAVCVLSLMVVAARIAWPRRGDDLGEDVAKVGGVLIGVVLISGASALISGLLGSHRIQAGDAAGFVQSRTWWYVLALAMLSVVIAGARMAWEQRAQPAKDLAQSLLTLVVVAGCGVAVIAFLTRAGDDFSQWIIADSLRCGDDTTACFGDKVGAMLGLTGASAPGLGVVMTIVLGLLALITSLTQIMLMIARSAMLVLLAGVLPLTAAATNTEWGRQWFKKAVAWIVAFLLYKPVCAIIYATAFQLLGSKDPLITESGDTTGLVRSIGALMLMIISVIALPALMRFVTPAVGSMGAGSNAGMAAAAGIVPAMGAVSAVGRFSGGEGAASGGGGGAPAPASASGAGGASSGGGSGGGWSAGSGDGGSKPGGGQQTPAAASSTTSGGASGAASAAGTGAAAAATGGATLVAEGAKATTQAAQGAVQSLADQAHTDGNYEAGQ